jgi:hypothetical protein
MKERLQFLLNEAVTVQNHLMSLMLVETDMKRFRNIAAVYIVWQNEYQNISNEL